MGGRMHCCWGGAAGIAVVMLALGMAPAEHKWVRVPLPFVDEASQEPALEALRERLLAALAEKDVLTVQAALAPSEFPPWDEFNTTQEIDALRRILSLGGSFTTTRGAKEGRREFCAPYVYSTWPETQLPYQLEEGGDQGPPMAVVAKDVPVRKRPDSGAEILTYVSYEIVGVPGEASPYDGRPVDWQAINTPDHGKGFVPPGVLYDPEDYYVCFAEFPAGWMITRFTH